MSFDSVSAREHIDAVITTLESASLVVYDAAAPSDATGKYCVVHGVAGGRNHGTLENPWEDAEIPVQVTCVATTREQADWVRDKAMVLCDGFEVAGRLITLVIPEGQPARFRETEVTPSVFTTIQRFTIRSTPFPQEVSG